MREINQALLDANRAREETAFARQFPQFMHSQYVPGECAEVPDVMVIGEAPGAQEDARGRPFCGESGIILRMLMQQNGVYPKRVARKITHIAWLTNTIKLRPPGNARPGPAMLELARPFLRTEWEAIAQPRIIVCVGGVARMAVMGNAERLPQAAPVTVAGDGGINVMWFMTHPSVAVRNKGMQPIIEREWVAFGRWLSDRNS